MQKAVQIIYKGRVQGVGFRFTAVDLASKFKVTGYVMNSHDGNVEVVAEGEAEAVNNYIAALNEQMARFIHSSVINPMPYTGQYRSFRIKY